MDIKSVKLVNSGFKGFDVVVLKEEEKEGRKKINKITERPRHPIHHGLTVPFKDLRYHLLEICDIIKPEMSKQEVDSLINECEIESVEIEPDYFVIKGTKHVFAEKSFTLKTPKVDSEDGYEHYDTVMNILERITEEVEHYLSGSVKVTDEEIAIRWIGAKEPGFDEAAFHQLPDEERKRICMETIEKLYGGTVLMPEDLEMEDNETKFDDEESIEIDLSKEEIKIPR